jgi:hypothetical protein
LAALDHHYNGFISYSRRRDARIAAWLQGRLESFLDGREMPEPRPEPLVLCRDGNDFNLLEARGDVFGLLEAYLDRADKLILLCGTATPRSTFIEHEIRWFLSNRRADDIVLCITDQVDPNTGGRNVFPDVVIAAGLEQRPYFDLIGLRRSSPVPSRHYDAALEQVAQLAANLLRRSWGEIEPSLARESALRRRRLRWTWGFVGCAALILTGAALWQWQMARNAREERLVEARATGLAATARGLFEPLAMDYGTVIDARRFLKGAFMARDAAAIRAGAGQEVIATAASHLPLPPAILPAPMGPSWGLPDSEQRGDVEGRWADSCADRHEYLWYAPGDAYAVTFRSESEPMLLINDPEGCKSLKLGYTGIDLADQVVFSPHSDYFAIVGSQGNYCCGSAISVFRYDPGSPSLYTMFPLPGEAGERAYAVGPQGELAIGQAGAITVYSKDKEGSVAKPFAYLVHPSGDEELELVSFNQTDAVLARGTTTGRGLVFDLKTVAEIRNPASFILQSCIEGVTFAATDHALVVKHCGDGESPAYSTIDLKSFAETELAAGTPAPSPAPHDREPPVVADLDVALDENSNVVVRDARTGIALALFATLVEANVQELIYGPEVVISPDQRWVAVFWGERTPSGEWNKLLLYDVTGRSVLENLCARLPEVASERLGPGFAATLVNHSIACPS